VVAVAASTLNAEGRTGATSLGVVAFNIVLIAAVALLLVQGITSTPAAGVVLASAVVVAGGVQMLFVGGALMRSPLAPRRLRLSLSSDTRALFALAVPGLIAAGIPQLKLIAGSIVASPSEAAVSWLYYTYRLYELPLGSCRRDRGRIGPAVAASVRAADASKLVASVQSARVRDPRWPRFAGRRWRSACWSLTLQACCSTVAPSVRMTPRRRGRHQRDLRRTARSPLLAALATGRSRSRIQTLMRTGASLGLRSRSSARFALLLALRPCRGRGLNRTTCPVG
jgi:hypothetical protein